MAWDMYSGGSSARSLHRQDNGAVAVTVAFLRRGIPSIDNVHTSRLSQSAVFRARFRRTPACCHDAYMFTMGITSGLE